MPDLPDSKIILLAIIMEAVDQRLDQLAQIEVSLRNERQKVMKRRAKEDQVFSSSMSERDQEATVGLQY